LGEFNAVIGPGLPADSFEANEASLLLKLLAFNLAGMIRGELEDSSGSGWDLRRVQQTVLKAGARVVQHSLRLFVDVAKAAGVLWARVLDRVGRWWQDPAWGRDSAGQRRGPHPRPWVPRHRMPTGPWSCGSDRRTTRSGSLPTAIRPMGVRGRFALPGTNQPQPCRIHA